MELRHLRYFVRVADELHFGRAAEQLGISQPPLSQQIRMLEEELGVQLLERSSRKVRLTAAGRLFLDEARATLERADRAVRITRRAASGELGELRIGLTASALFLPLIAGAMVEHRRRYPDVHLDVAEHGTQAQRDGVIAGGLDIGFLRSGRRPMPAPELEVTLVAADRMFVAMPLGHRLGGSAAPISLAELAGEPMVHYPYDRDGFFEDLYRLFEGAGVRPLFAQETREMSTLLGLVSAGIGITVLPGSLRRLKVDDLRYRELSDPLASSYLWMIHRAGQARPTAQAFVNLIHARIAESGPTANATA